MVVGEEVAPTTGTPHLQGYIVFRSAKTLSACRRLFPGCHLIAARGSAQQNRDYCTKSGGNFREYGNMPGDAHTGGNLEKVRWERAWEAAIAGRIDDVPADIRIRQYSSLRRIERDYMPAVPRLDAPCGLWIWGDSGAGKTRAVLDRYPDAFPKPRTVWWDGYQREPVVLLDDVDKFDVRLGGKLKHWADCYPFIAETKGGSQKIRPERLIVTSQYRIEDIWTDEETKSALLRRFIVVKKELGQNILI